MQSYYKQNVSIPVLDQLQMVLDLEERFDAQQVMFTNALYFFPVVIEDVCKYTYCSEVMELAIICFIFCKLPYSSL